MKFAGRDRGARLLLGLALSVLAFGAHTAVAEAVPSFSINDVSMNEGNSSTTDFTFTVTLSNPPAGNFTIMVDAGTTNGTATGGSTCGLDTDYLSRQRQLTFNRMNLTRTFAVPVCGDTVAEPDETFFVDLSNPTGGAVITDGRGDGTIRNDDGAFKRPTTTSVSCAAPTIGVPATCTATVTDTGSGVKTTPSGTVAWSSSSGGTFAPTSCTLNPTATVGVASCTTSYTATSAGTAVVTGAYGGDLTHESSQGQTTVQVGKRSTSTSVSCTPASVAVGDKATCTATVSDSSGGSASTPGGTVSWSSSGAGTFSSSSCTLDASGKCSVDYTPSAVGTGTHTVTGMYSGDAAHNGSSGSAALTVTKRSTSTSVSCTPASVAVGEKVSCTATVTDSSGGSASTPGGTVSWSSNGAGNFSSSSCTLNGSGSCSVDYTPSAVGTGTHTITGSYDGDASHTGSSGSYELTVTKRSTSTSVSCTPATVVVDDSSTCTATVTDSSGGSASTPGGTVSWSSDGAGTFSSSSCTLNASGSCSVQYTPSAVGTGTHTVTGSYGGDDAHTGSSGSDEVTVTKRSTSTSVSCTPSSFQAGGETTCTATVADTSGGSASTPTGDVSWSSDGAGTFSSASCTLDTSGKCSVKYTSTKAGTDEITGSYGGDDKHATSSGATSVTVRPGPPADVDVAPAQATNTAGEEHCVTATVTDAYGNAVEAGVNVHFSVTGANPRSSTAVPTGADGKATFCYTGTKAGDDTIKAVADRDTPPNGPDDGDPAGQASKTYNPGPPARVTVEPATATNPVRTQHCVTATVTDRFDNPVKAGIDVYFSVTGANPSSGDTKVATDAGGQAKFCYTGRNGGTDTIKAVADRDNPPNGADAGDPSGTASKTWLSNVPCRVQGTGTISSTQQFNFGVEFFSGATAPVGSATYIDSGQGKQLTATRIDGLVCFGVSGGAHAIFFGRALVNGVPVSDFQVDIDDLGSGPGTDKFAIQWPGYSASGTLVTGDIQITLG
jgi:large repetitive protein